MIELGGAALLVVKVTLVLLLGLALRGLAGRQSAAFRHAIAATTLAAAATVPLAFAWLPSIPVMLEMRAMPLPVNEPTDERSAFAIDSSTTRPRSGPARSSVLWAVWATGAAICLLPALAMGYQSRRLRREGQAWRVIHATVPTWRGARPASIPLLLHDGLSSPVACGILSTAIALPASSRTWTALDLERAVAHELAHVKRADVLVHALARAVCAAYWFHPLVWMCSHTLRLEAERACDDEVAGQFDSTDYADQLLRLARAMAGRDAWTSLPTMARPGELAIRVQALLDPRQPRAPMGVGRGMQMVLSGLSLAAWLGCLTPMFAHTVADRSPHVPTFASSSIRESSPGESMALVRHPDGSVRITAAPLRVLIRLAYGVQDQAIVDAPAWMASARFSIDATPPANAGADATVTMLRSLLADRFALRVVQGSRTQRVFSLRASARGSDLRPATPCLATPMTASVAQTQTRSAPARCGFRVAPGRIDATAADLHELAATLSTFLDAQVVVESARADRFDLRLRWPATDTGVATLIDALRTQAGLEVSERQQLVPVLAIQSARRPT